MCCREISWLILASPEESLNPPNRERIFLSSLDATGQWVKKVRGKFHYFGKVADDSKDDSIPLVGRLRREEVGRPQHTIDDWLDVVEHRRTRKD
jgi:hypothetical protein